MSRSRSFSRSPRQTMPASFNFFSSSTQHQQQPALPPSHTSSISAGNLLEANSQPTDLHHSMSTNHSSFRGMRRLEARRQMEESNFLFSKKSHSNLNPPVDLRLLDYVSPPDPNLTCPICRSPFLDPVILTECDHCFCRDCIRQTWLATSTTSAGAGTHYTPLGNRGNCPSCRTPARLGLRSDNGTGNGNGTIKILVNILDDLLVQCPHHSEGCPATVKRGEVLDHVGIYCGYTKQPCVAEDCSLPVRRKDAERGQECLHYGVSCLDCREAMLKADLEAHWRTKCADRRVPCSRCHESVLSREMEMHVQDTCSAVEMECPGVSLGCTNRSKRSQAELHAEECTFARLAPVLAAQQQRIDEQEAAQRVTSRKLEVLENGFEAVRGLLYPEPSVQAEDEDVRADERRIPLLLGDNLSSPRGRHRRVESAQADVGEEELGIDKRMGAFVFPVPLPSVPNWPLSSTEEGTSDTSMRATAGLPPSRPAPLPPGLHPSGLSALLPDFHAQSSPPTSTNLPGAYNYDYDSPLHHLLSLHESLREEFARLSAALQDLDARQSLHTLNENLRMREEMGFLGAQVAGLRGQVGWLVAAQLQRAGGGGGRYGGGGGGGGGSVGGGGGAERAVDGSEGITGPGSAAREGAEIAGGSAVRAVAGRSQVRRRASEEGRTKL